MQSHEATRESAEDPSARNAGLQSVLPDGAQTARPIVGPLPPTPVETLDDLDIAHRLRSMLTDEQTPDLLRRVYRDLRECIDASAVVTEDQAVQNSKDGIEPFFKALVRRTSALEKENASMRSLLDAQGVRFTNLTQTSPGANPTPDLGGDARGSIGRPSSESSTSHSSRASHPPNPPTIGVELGGASMQPPAMQAARPAATVPGSFSQHDPSFPPAPHQVPDPFAANPTVLPSFGAPSHHR